MKQAFAQNFIHSDSESGESSSPDGSINDFSDKSSSEDASEMSSYARRMRSLLRDLRAIKKTFFEKRGQQVSGEINQKTDLGVRRKQLLTNISLWRRVRESKKP